MRRGLRALNQAVAGPAGAAGPTGATGATGATGPTGPAGVVIQAYNTADSVTLNNVTAATAFSTSWNAAANFFTVGQILRARWSGYLTPNAAQNVTLGTFIGAAGGTPDAYTVPTTPANYHFEVEMLAICRSTGAAGQFSMTTKWVYAKGTTNVNQIYLVTFATLSIDTTAAQLVQLQFGSTVANNSGVVRSFTVETFN